jgi:4-hydroxybenzoate polyprenyltransferase
LDGTLLLSDSLLESFCRLLRESPWTILLIPFWLVQGRANLKSQIARRIKFDVSSWPLNPEVLRFVQEAKQQGRKIVLATAADSRIAAAMQARLNLFDEILASDGTTNLSGKTKAIALVQRFGENRFDYVGNSSTDLPVWKVSRRAFVVAGCDGLARRVEKVAKVERVFAAHRAGPKDWIRALRIHQWAKNLLLLVPLLGAHKWTDPTRLVLALSGVAAFSLCASSVYLLNDLLDLESDRHHHSKRQRPFASGKIPILNGILIATFLLIGAAVIACSLGGKFAAIFGTYYFATLFYSLRLKQVELLDVLTLAGLYGMRVLAGGIVAHVLVSDWLMMFSLFIFLSLALAKRFTEIRIVRSASGQELKGRAYVVGDAELISSMGVGSGYLSVLVLAMYINHPTVTALYNHPQALWLACPLLLYWTSRVWLLAHRGVMHDDPILFALRDRQSWLVVGLLAVIGYIAGPK